MEGREKLPVLVTLNLVRGPLDSTSQTLPTSALDVSLKYLTPNRSPDPKRSSSMPRHRKNQLAQTDYISASQTTLRPFAGCD